MTNDLLQKTAFLYGRNVEKRRRTDVSKDLGTYREYDAMCLSLYREMLENGAIDDTAMMIKAEYTASYEAGRDSVVEYWQDHD